MRRFLAISFIGVVLIAAGASAPAAHADPAAGHGNDQYGNGIQEGGSIYSESASAAASAAGSSAEVADPTPDQNPAGTNIPQNPPIDNASLFATVISWIMTLFAWLLGVAAITLDNSVYYTVVTMGSYIHNLAAVGLVWSIMRDVGNIILIFGFLIAGINTILETDIYGWTSKMLPKLLLAAILMNFSLFITEAVIDTGNMFASQFYTQINGGQPAGQKLDFSHALASVGNEGISNKIMAQLGLQSVYGDAVSNQKVLQGSNSWLIGFMGIILFITTAFVFFSLAFILIMRFVILLYVIIISPIGFAGWVTPRFKFMTDYWQKNLIDQTITAPILFLLLYIALRLITDANFLTGFGVGKGDGYTEFIKQGSLGNFASLILSFLVAMGALLVVIMVAKKMSAFGADWAVKMGGRLSYGASAYGLSAGWNAIGHGGRRFVQRVAPNSAVSRYATRWMFRPMEDARVDVRRLPGMGKGMSALGAQEAAKPIEKSATGRVRQGVDWWKTSKKEDAKVFEKEARIPLLQSAVAANNRNDIKKYLRAMDDDELTSSTVLALLPNNPEVIQQLTPKQAGALPDNVLTDPAVYLHMSPQQLEGVRSAGNIAPHNAEQIGLASLTGGTPAGGGAAVPAPTGTAHTRFQTWFNGRNRQQQDDIRQFWGF